MLHKHRGSGLAALDAQIEGAAAGLREIGARLEAIKATATTIHSDAAHELQAEPRCRFTSAIRGFVCS